MSVKIQKKKDGRIVIVSATGKLAADDYRRFVPDVEEAVRRFGKIRIMFVMQDFHGWDAGALWEDITFDAKHFSDIERLALVGDRQWEKGMSVFCRPFTTADINYFDLAEMQRAAAWIQEGMEAAAGSEGG